MLTRCQIEPQYAGVGQRAGVFPELAARRGVARSAH
jgi:hypothetical protein